MKPIYFPFTYVSDPVAEAISACFGQFVVYGPVREIISKQMQLWINRGIMDVRVPVVENDKALKNAVKNYEIWADLHREDSREKSAFLKTRTSPVPFLSEFSSAKIIENIKGKAHDKSNTQISDPVLTAQIFLYFAQEFDRQNQELTEGLNHYDQQEADLIHRLKMEDDPVAEEMRNTAVRVPDSLAEYMISDRLEAWARLFWQEPEETGLFVTHSPAVMEYLLDRSATAARVIRLESIPPGPVEGGEQQAWQKNLAALLARLAGKELTESGNDQLESLKLPDADNTAALSVYRIPDQTPHEFYGHYAEMNSLPAAGAGRKGQFDNVLIALVEI